MAGVKREATENGPADETKRPKQEEDVAASVSASTNPAAVKREDTNNNNTVAAENNNGRNNNDNDNDDNNDDDDDDDAILKRLDRLEAENMKRETENRNLKEEVKRLQDCCSTKLVEFKFTSMETHLLNDNEWNGVLHIPMIQNPVSGEYMVATGTTTVQGSYSYNQCCTTVQGSYSDNQSWDNQIITKDFVATLKRDSGQQRIETFHIGIDLQYSVTGSVATRLKPSVLPTITKTGENWTTEEFVTTDQDMLNKWEENSGGVLSFYAPASIREHGSEFNIEYNHDDLEGIVDEAKYKIKLNTVLSAYKPHQTHIPSVDDVATAKPNWELLEGVVKSRYPDRSNSDIKEVVQEYVYFLELKKELSDYKSQLFTPSVEIDKVWHAHLSFLDRYQRDIQALTKVENKVFEHNPVLGAQARERYITTRDAHAERMLTKSKPVDIKFWPESVRIVTNHALPRRLQRQAFVGTFEDPHDGDSNNALYAGDVAEDPEVAEVEEVAEDEEAAYYAEAQCG